MKHTTPNTTTSPETAIDLSTLAAELDTSIQALKKAIHLEPSTGELSSPAAFCEALDITSEAYHNLVYCWGSNAFHNIPEPAAGTAEGVALGTLRGIGDRRFVDRERRASAKPVDDKLQSFAARVEGDNELVAAGPGRFGSRFGSHRRRPRGSAGGRRGLPRGGPGACVSGAGRG